MDITPLIPSGQKIIQSYADGYFRVSGQVYAGAIIVSSDHVENHGRSNHNRGGFPNGTP